MSLPPILPLPDDPTDNEETLWNMIAALRRSLFGSGGPLASGGNFFSCFDGSLPSSQSGFDSTFVSGLIMTSSFDGAASNTVTGWEEKEVGLENPADAPTVFTLSGINYPDGTITDNSLVVVPFFEPALATPRRKVVGYMHRSGDWSDDQYSKATITGHHTVPNVGGLAPGSLGVRINPCKTGDKATGYYIVADPVSLLITLRRLDTDGTTTQLGSTAAFAINDTLEIRAVGTTISVSKNGNEVISVTDSTYLAGKPCFLQGQRVTTPVPGFESTDHAARQSWNDWEGHGLNTIMSGGDCGDGAVKDCSDDFYPGQVFIVGMFGQVSTACGPDLVVDPLNHRVGINACRPNASLDVYDGKTPNKRIFAADTDEVSIFNTRLRLDEISSPGTPPANSGYLYAKDKSGTSALYFKNDAGTEAEVGAGTVTGTGVNRRTAFWTGVSALSSDADFVWDNTNKRLGLRIGIPLEILHLQTSGSICSEVLDSYNTSGSNRAMLEFRTAQGTSGSPSNVASGNQIGELLGEGYAGGAFRVVAGFVMEVDTGTIGATSLPSRIRFQTTPDGSISRATRFQIGSSGQWGIGGTTYGTAGQYFRSGGASAAPTWATIDHGSEVGGLGDDDHTQYVLLVGRAATPDIGASGLRYGTLYGTTIDCTNAKFGTHTAIGAETVTGYITITDKDGNSRKLAVVS